MTARKNNILVIDDDPNIFNLIKFYLGQDTYFLQPARSGKSALKILSAETYDLLLVDMLMPEMDGLTFITEIQNELHIQSQVIMITAQEPSPTALEQIFKYAFDIIQKPFTANRLRFTVRNALRYQHLLNISQEVKKSVGPDAD